MYLRDPQVSGIWISHQTDNTLKKKNLPAKNVHGHNATWQTSSQYCRLTASCSRSLDFHSKLLGPSSLARNVFCLRLMWCWVKIFLYILMLWGRGFLWFSEFYNTVINFLLLLNWVSFLTGFFVVIHSKYLFFFSGNSMRVHSQMCHCI